jgi:hypothetical protein
MLVVPLTAQLLAPGGAPVVWITSAREAPGATQVYRALVSTKSMLADTPMEQPTAAVRAQGGMTASAPMASGAGHGSIVSDETVATKDQWQA